MSPQPETDWFTANAPKAGAASSGDWFSQNAPQKTVKTSEEPPSSWLEPSPGEGWVSRVAKGFGRNTIGAVTGTLHAITAPPDITAPAGGDIPGTDPVSIIARTGKRMLVDPSVQAEQHIDELAAAHGTKGTLPYYAGKALAAVPLVGPWALSAGERAGKGDVAGAMGEVVGSALLPEIAKGVGKIPGKLNEIVPSTTRAGAGINALEKVYGEHPIQPSGALDTISRFERELEPTPSVNLPPIIKDFQGRMMETSPALGSAARPFTFAEARTFLKRANEAAGSMGEGVERNATRSFAQSLSDDIDKGVAQSSPIAPNGFQPDYQKFTKEYRQGKGVIRAGDEAGPVLGAAAGWKAGHSLTSSFVGGAVGKFVGKKTIGAATRAVIERPGTGSMSPPSPPPVPIPTIPKSPDEWLRTVLAAKEGYLSPGEADRRITRGGGSTKVSRPVAPPE